MCQSYSFYLQCFSLDLPKQVSMFESMNTIMVEVYKMIFDDVLPRVLEDMRVMLQSSSEGKTGDWCLHKEFTVIRVYGFTEEPYKLPDLLTPRVFALEFIRQRLCAEEEHFIAFKKSSDVKFPLNFGPFIFKNKSALLVVEKLLEVMDFEKEEKMNYDPHHIISQRRKLNKNKPFDHQVIKGLDKMANLFSFEEDPEVMKEEMMEADEDKRDKLALTVQISVNSCVINKKDSF